MSNPIRRIAICTGGGDAPGLNAVIRSVVIAAANRGWESYGIHDGFNGILFPERYPEGGVYRLTRDKVRGIGHLGGTILGTTNKGNPLHFPVQMPDGTTRDVDRTDEILQFFAMKQLDALVSIGGDGSLTIANALHQKGLRVVGVPKTIDNDLDKTFTTFGFDTAVAFATECLDRLHSTAQSHQRVMVIEVMGRYAGWIALESGLTGGAHIILVPEIPYSVESVLARIRRHWDEEHRNYTLIVVAEGAFPAGGHVQHIEGGRSGSVARVGGAAATLEAALREAMATWDRPRGAPEVRATVLGHIQRGGSPCAYDRFISLRFGAEAATLALAGKWNRMVCLRGTAIENVPLLEGIDKPHNVDPAGQLVQHARAVGICFGD